MSLKELLKNLTSSSSPPATSPANSSSAAAGYAAHVSGVTHAADVSAVTGVLMRLDMLFVTKEVLVKTGIGLEVRALCKHSHLLIAQRARELVARWKVLTLLVLLVQKCKY
jgi:hypothetical protein